MRSKQFFGMSVLVMAAIIWGASFVFQLQGGEYVDAFTFCGARMTLAAVSVGIATLFFERKNGGFGNKTSELTALRKNNILGGICCGICLAVALIVQQIGVPMTTASKAGFVSAMYIILVPVAGAVFFNKKIPPLGWFAVAMGVVGMYLLCVKDKLTFGKGDLIILASSLVYGVHLFLCDHFSKAGDPLRISSIQMIVAAVLGWISAFVLGDPSLEEIKLAIIPVLYCGLMSGGAGYTFQIIGQRYIDPVRATLTLSSESVFAVVFGVLLLKETMSLKELMGCVLMMIAIVIIQWSHKDDPA